MGLIHTRASKQRDKAEARLLKEELHRQQDAQRARQPWWAQRTLRQALLNATGHAPDGSQESTEP